ncbi:hypothetical protein HZU38_18910 [Mycolicibacterium vanbaalenii]|uniref:hypothetical protein n=1 Tax=Mycolicibacterium vanbaalenii TaxID=110539 RepID=UPI001F23538D|nr:hypothetical protein [Mycolicibacterium vanbaalenii]UJL27014.1 hypothetical protein HZU38_18910 [Mycolicibacterium vanbaalenii]WND59137.1 hypothetical protein QQA43_12515 [Mycolicibacterium vanbaalenii]
MTATWEHDGYRLAGEVRVWLPSGGYITFGAPRVEFLVAEDDTNDTMLTVRMVGHEQQFTPGTWVDVSYPWHVVRRSST